MATNDLTRELKKKEIRSVFLVAGEEDVLIDRALAQLSARVLSENGNDFSLTRLDGKTTSFSEIENAVRTGNLFGGQRLVMVRDAIGLKSADQKKLLLFLEQPVAMTTLVLVVRGVGLSSRTPKLAKAVNSLKKIKEAVDRGGGLVVDCPRPKPKDLLKLAQQMLTENELRADRDGLYALVETVGEDLTALAQGVEKLALYLEPKSIVSAKDVSEVVANTKSQSVFALTDTVSEGAVDRALWILGGMLREGESPLSLLAHLVRHFRNLASVQALVAQGSPESQIKSRLSMHPFVVKKCILQSRRFSPGKLAGCMEALLQTDLRLKQSRMDDRLILESLVIDLASKRC